MNCKHCGSQCVKQGFQKDGTQKYLCKGCSKYQQETYRYKAYEKAVNTNIIKQVNRGSGIRDIAYILEISASTVIRRIRYIASLIEPPLYTCKFQEYEMDEMYTNVWLENRKTPIYVSYAINKATGESIGFTIGSRDSKTLQKVVGKMLLNYPRQIRTDKWSGYSSIIPRHIHITNKYKINKIERNHLTMRMQLKRLSRVSLCQSKKLDMLEACLKIYFWG
jgi:insertion element IS1 protein InsB